ncbi:uncharacterized protein PV09_09457 [Verruconis gallopava]|uniref:Rhodopsin domain-containing protein n=1 Tax=Verruconis gallopava TaxID=253628 RepID=A0A0D1ZWD5_9PEZI|nr:uncharacterized protein PV09_09457 [Verruconis gallopava]KIV98807.1 hypothetical protein PV09_09457 [Verruconis gallopava]
MSLTFYTRFVKREPENLQHWVVEVVASMTTLAVVSVGLRLLSRYLKRSHLWWDDWMVLFSMGWNLVVVGFIFAMYSSGMGIHADQVPMTSIVMMAKWLLVAELLYAWNLCWTKIAVLLMYYRIFRFPFFKRMAYVIGSFVVIWGITITFVFIFICTPVQKIWYPEIPGHCVYQVGTWIANATSTIISDVAILVLPIREVWKLQLRKFEKIAVSITFSLGFFVVFASAYRFSVLFTYTPSDPTYTLARTVGWTSIEMSAGIVSACLPVLRPVLQALTHSMGVYGLFSHSDSRDVTAKSRSESTRQMSSQARGAADLELDEQSFESRDALGAWRNGNEIDCERLVDYGNLKLRPEHGFVYCVGSAHENNPSQRDKNRPIYSITVEKDFKHYTSQK